MGFPRPAVSRAAGLGSTWYQKPPEHPYSLQEQLEQTGTVAKLDKRQVAFSRDGEKGLTFLNLFVQHWKTIITLYLWSPDRNQLTLKGGSRAEVWKQTA